MLVRTQTPDLPTMACTSPRGAPGRDAASHQGAPRREVVQMGNSRRDDKTPNRRDLLSKAIAAAGVVVNAPRLIWEITRHIN